MFKLCQASPISASNFALHIRKLTVAHFHDLGWRLNINHEWLEYTLPIEFTCKIIFNKLCLIDL